MKLRRSQPVNTPQRRCHHTSAERPATTFARRRCSTLSARALPAGVLARLLARKNRLLRQKIEGVISLRQMGLPLLDGFRASSSGPKSR